MVRKITIQGRRAKSSRGIVRRLVVLFLLLAIGGIFIWNSTVGMGRGEADTRSSSTIGTNNTTTTSTTTEEVPPAPPEEIDSEKLLAELEQVLGSSKDNYGIYIEDLKTGQKIGWKIKDVFPPGSISKLPGVILLLRDIDSGKRSFDDTYPIQNKLKHSTSDALGRLPEGTQVKLRTYIEETIRNSNNTGQYHIRVLLGGQYEAVIPHTQAELGAGNFFEDPHTARPRDVGKVLAGVYRRELLSEELASYLINLMKNTAPSLRVAIPEALQGTGAEVANKVGFLFGGKEGNVYNDSAVVFGKHRDYVLVVLNNKAPAYPQGRLKIQEIAKVVHKYMDVE